MFNRRSRRIIHSGLRIMNRAKLRTFLMMLSIIIGIKALTLTINLGSGIEKKIMDNVGRFVKPNNIIVLSEKFEAKGIRESENGPNTALKIEDVEAIVKQTGNINTYDYMQVLPEKEVNYSGVNYFTKVKGCRPIGEEIWNKPVKQGRFFDESELKDSKRVAVLGPKIAKILFKNEDPIGKQFKLCNIPFTVIGIAEAQGSDPHGRDLDDEMYIPITTLMRRVANIDYIMAAKFEFQDGDQIVSGESAITDILRQRHALAAGEPNDFNLMTPIHVKKVVASMVKLFNVLLPAIAAIALLAGAIVIIVLMSIGVNQRVKEIGLRKAIGAKDSDIRLQFIAESIAIVLIGGFIGMTVGLVVSKIVSARLNATFYISMETIIVGIILPILIGLISGIIPARKAAKLNPIDSMKS